MRQPRWTGMILAVTLALVTSVANISSLPSFSSFPNLANAATDKREIQAREAFGAGRYQEALDIFVRLYAEKVHPNYLRNIGRCYQNLGEPDKAISSFREYLRQAKSIRPVERQEVEGYIKEMEELKRQRTSTPGTATAVVTPPPPEPTGTTSAVAAGTSTGNPNSSERPSDRSGSVPMAQNTEPSGQTPGTTLVQSPQTGSGSEAADESRPVYTRWWFWTLIGGAIVGGVAVAAATGAFSRTQDATCAGCK
jgi:hypothetical protein